MSETQLLSKFKTPQAPLGLFIYKVCLVIGILGSFLSLLMQSGSIDPPCDYSIWIISLWVIYLPLCVIVQGRTHSWKTSYGESQHKTFGGGL